MRVKVALSEGAAILIIAAAHFHSFGASGSLSMCRVARSEGAAGCRVPGWCAGAAAVGRVCPRPAHAVRCIRADRYMHRVPYTRAITPFKFFSTPH